MRPTPRWIATGSGSFASVHIQPKSAVSECFASYIPPLAPKLQPVTFSHLAGPMRMLMPPASAALCPKGAASTRTFAPRQRRPATASGPRKLAKSVKDALRRGARESFRTLFQGACDEVKPTITESRPRPRASPMADEATLLISSIAPVSRRAVFAWRSSSRGLASSVARALRKKDAQPLASCCWRPPMASLLAWMKLTTAARMPARSPKTSLLLRATSWMPPSVTLRSRISCSSTGETPAGYSRWGCMPLGPK
mmetsp:Transcript_16942/g.49595  ORF Transcript_16942/g.49595 Transcript_16942/m.49595 type:complete len:254 (+) Transcript_16942:419-1180(+)